MNRPKILFGWETGGGFGHVGPFLPVASRLLADQVQLAMAVRDLSRVQDLALDIEVQLFQAPTKVHRAPVRYPHPVTLPQIFHNVGYGVESFLQTMTRAWCNLIRLAEVDLIVLDHSFSAMIACRITSTPFVLFGTGFTCPPPVQPMQAFVELNAPSSVESSAAVQAEESLLNVSNAVLHCVGAEPLDSVGELYGDAHHTILTTFAEFDPYLRKDAEYSGVWGGGQSTEDIPWPAGSGHRIFAYLKPSRGLGHLFDFLRSTHYPTLVVGDGLDIPALRELATPNLRFCDHPLSIDKVASQCDLAILNGTHTSTCSLLLAGKPIFQIPHNLEQRLNAERTVQLGAGLLAHKDDGRGIIRAFQNFLVNLNKHRVSAEQFSSSHSDYRPEEHVQIVASKIRECASD